MDFLPRAGGTGLERTEVMIGEVLAYCGSRMVGYPFNDPCRLSRGDFLSYRDWKDRYMANYLGEGGQVCRSSRLHPASVDEIKPGTWLIDDQPGPYGHDIGVCLHLDPHRLLYSEDPRERFEDVIRYQRWRTDGLVPPPINVVETERGNLMTSDGHRRTEAARRARTFVPAFVWPAAHIPGIATHDGKPLITGLTWELAAFWSVCNGLTCDRGALAEIPRRNELASKIRRLGAQTCERFGVTHVVAA